MADNYLHRQVLRCEALIAAARDTNAFIRLVGERAAWLSMIQRKATA